MIEGTLIFEAKNVNKNFKLNSSFESVLTRFLVGKKTKMVKAVQDLSLAVSKGETLGIVGESGCGKSTLARMMSGIIPASSGEMHYKGNCFNQFLANPREALKVQMVFQDPLSSINPRHKVLHIIGEAPVAHGIIKKAQMRDYVVAQLETVGLSPDYVNRFPHQFSGGQRQRISIARALAVKPEFLICDEAVAALDVSVQAQIINLLMDIKRQFDLTVVFISHDLSVIRHFCNRVLVMYLGRTVEIAKTAELFNNPIHPYTRTLIAGMPRISLHRREFLPITGEIPSPLNPPSGCAFHTRCPDKTSECIRQSPPLVKISKSRSHACLNVRRGINT